jgi:hypothetical protein
MNIETSKVQWVEAADNPWGVRVLDIRPVTLTMLSMSKDPHCAENVGSYDRDDGTAFLGKPTPVPRTTKCCLTFRRDRLPADGAVFIPPGDGTQVGNLLSSGPTAVHSELAARGLRNCRSRTVRCRSAHHGGARRLHCQGQDTSPPTITLSAIQSPLRYQNRAKTQFPLSKLSW